MYVHVGGLNNALMGINNIFIMNDISLLLLILTRLIKLKDVTNIYHDNIIRRLYLMLDDLHGESWKCIYNYKNENI